MSSAVASISAFGSAAIVVMHEQGSLVFDHAYCFAPEHRWKQDVEIARWCEQRFAPYPIYNAEAHLVQIEHLPRPFRQIGGLRPNLILCPPPQARRDLGRRRTAAGHASTETLIKTGWHGRLAHAVTGGTPMPPLWY